MFLQMPWRVSKLSREEILPCGSGKIHEGKQTGVAVYDKGEGRLEECDVFGNKLAGVEIWRGANPFLHSTNIFQGKQTGVMVYDQGEGTLEKCDIYENEWAGVAIYDKGNPTIRDCKIHDAPIGRHFRLAGRHREDRGLHYL